MNRFYSILSYNLVFLIFVIIRDIISNKPLKTREYLLFLIGFNIIHFFLHYKYLTGQSDTSINYIYT